MVCSLGVQVQMQHVLGLDRRVRLGLSQQLSQLWRSRPEAVGFRGAERVPTQPAEQCAAVGSGHSPGDLVNETSGFTEIE